MNQILYKNKQNSNLVESYNINNQNSFYTYNKYNNSNNKLIMSKKRFIIIVSFAIITIIIAIIIYAFSKYNLNKNEFFSKKLISNYNVMTLYSNSINNYTATTIENKIDNQDANSINNNTAEPFIIGLIQIEKIKLIYPILSTTNDELLKISPCRFAGPMANKVGNLCIAGHNYVDNKLFSKLYVLDIGDNIKIYDLSSNIIEYKIYYKEEILYNDLSCTDQHTNGKRQITLITCNNVSGNRLCIKANEE